MVLFEHGILARDEPLGAVAVRRGMSILSCGHDHVGYVAAVVMADKHSPPTHLLLVQPYGPPQYRLLPVNLIAQVNQETVVIKVKKGDIFERSFGYEQLFSSV